MSEDVKSKELKVRVATGKGSLREIYWEGGGEVPQVLNGLYTGIQDAQRDIVKYLSTKRVVSDEPKPSKRGSKEL
jgi:hypothetical protein|tara:strand:+ start:690 stop:914 length:225 start_codon:yes stop_codon:yes gene_type:complete